MVSVKAKVSSKLSLNQVEPQSKKRKLESQNEDGSGWTPAQSYSDISFSLPQRKKLKLDISTSPSQGLRGTNAAGDIEVIAGWSQIDEVFCLPVPEKSQPQYNFCVLLNLTEGTNEQILWTIPRAIPKEGTVHPPFDGLSTDTYHSHMVSIVNQALEKRESAVIVPTDKEFSSQLVQAHRKEEKAYHVKAFRGAKDGFLFFLSNGIFWGFRKPLEFYPFNLVDSVSYTSVLQRTFNLNISFRKSPADAPQEFEFSMLDQEDFGGIDAYIKRHQLQDASMAEKRRAKKLNVNGVPADGDGNHEEAEGELQKAAREVEGLEDDDDEEEDENFDPGSEGESEGEGMSSEDEDEDAKEDDQGGHL